MERIYYGAITILFQIVFLTHLACGRVEIVQPYHPLYVKVGTDLNIRCESNNRQVLRWIRQTPMTQWQDEHIEATEGSEYAITTCEQEPSGFVESKLTKKNIGLYDRGTYTCRDQNEDSFSIWVTALKIFYRNETAFPGHTLQLQCNISGFDNNVPTIDYAWTKGGYAVDANDLRITSAISPLGHLELNITDPVESDVGHYQCMFFLYTNLGAITMQQDVFVQGSSNLESQGCQVSWNVLLLAASVLISTLLPCWHTPAPPFLQQAGV